MKSIRTPFILSGSSIILSSLMMLSNTAYAADTDSLWSTVPNYQQRSSSAGLKLMPDKYALYELDESGMNLSLTHSARSSTSATNTLSVPFPDGTLVELKLGKNSVLPPELNAKFPEIKTFDAVVIGRPGVTGVIGTGDQGFHGMLFAEDGRRIFIDRRESDSGEHYYISYYDSDYKPADKQRTKCNVEGHDHSKDGEKRSFAKYAQRTGSSKINYRLAMAVTGEYTAFHGGDKPKALAAISKTVARVNEIYIRDLGVDMTLVGTNDDIIYTDANTDPYDNDNLGSGTGLKSNQTTIDNTITSANYDIGHVMSTGGGGLAAYQSVCADGAKAQGMTALDQPSGDPFDIDYVAHEIGHQFGGSHSYNAEQGGSCNTRSEGGVLAFEPGSGSTIMGYAGICADDNIDQNLQQNTDAMFHVKSIEEMGGFIDNPDGGSSCGTASATGNAQPIASAGNDYTIPANTPFELTGSATDADGDNLTYSWEQVDAGTASDVDVDKGDNAIIRAYLPTPSPSRTIPKLTDILAGTSTKGEKLALNPRDLNFALAVRDQKGAVGIDTMKVTVATGGPFQVISHKTASTHAAGSTTLIGWSVAGTAVAPVSCTNVKILMSTDGGTTFPTILSSSTANDGNETVTIPGTTAANTTTRFKVTCATGNIFFNVSEANTTITAAIAATPNGTVAISSNAPQVGVALTATVTDADMFTAANVSYEWTVGTTVVTAASYTPVAADIGKTVTVKATYTDDKGTAESPSATTTAAVIAAAVTTNAPGTVTITGTAQVGAVLTAGVTDTNGEPAAIAYQWSANGTVIGGATGSTYTPVPADLGKTITVKATYTDNATHAEAPVSTATSPVVAAATAPETSVDGQPATASTTTPAVGSNTHFGTQNSVTGTGQARSYSVKNNGASATTVDLSIVEVETIAKAPVSIKTLLASLNPIKDAMAIGAGDFTVVPATQTIQPGQSASFAVTFKPTAPGLREAYLNFSTGGAVFNRLRLAGVGASAVSPAAAQNIPVFGPLGLLAMLAGLFFFGGKRRFLRKG